MNYKQKVVRPASTKTSSFYGPSVSSKTLYAYADYVPPYTNNLFHFAVDDASQFEPKLLRPYFRVPPGPRVLPEVTDDWRTQLPCYVHPTTKISPWMPNTKAVPLNLPVDHIQPYNRTPTNQYGTLQPRGLGRYLKPYYSSKDISITSKCEKLRKRIECKPEVVTKVEQRKCIENETF